MAYIGQTSRAIKIRVNEHKSNIRTFSTHKNEGEQNKDEKERNKKSFGETTVARHFNEKRHTVSELRWQVIEQIFCLARQNINLTLLQRESYWINHMETLHPKGLNEKCNMSVFL